MHPTGSLLAAAEEVVRECGASARAAPADVRAIGVASMAEAGVLLGVRGERLHDVLAWFDRRSSSAAQRLVAQVGAAELFARTGLRAEAKHSLAKLAWLADEQPDLVRRATAWAGVADLVAHAWTASLGTSASLACRTLAWDLRAGRWDAELLALAKIGPDLMPPVVPVDRPVGSLTDVAAGRLDLPSGVPVAVAGHDHLVGAFGAGVAHAGDVLDSLGTAEAVLRVTDRPRLEDAVRLAGFSAGAHVLPDRWYLGAGLAASGAMVEWALDLLGAPAVSAARYALLDELLERVPVAPTGIVVRPTPGGRSAPHPEPSATASIEGLRLGHDRASVMRAVLEGIAHHSRWLLDELAGLSGEPIRSVRVIGGGAANRHLLAIKAALGPGVLEAVAEPEAVGVGAALVGGLAAGELGSADDALRLAATASPVRVDGGLRDAYERSHRDRFLGGP